MNEENVMAEGNVVPEENVVEEGPGAPEQGRNRTMLRVGLSGPKLPVYNGRDMQVQDWISAIEKKALIYEISDKDKVMLAYDHAEGVVNDFIRGALRELPDIEWNNFKDELMSYFANEATSVDAMRTLMVLRQERGQTLQELANRAHNLAKLAYGEAKDTAVLQAQLAELFAKAIADREVSMDTMKSSPTNLNDALAVARDSERMYQKLRDAAIPEVRRDAPGWGVDDPRPKICRTYGRQGHGSSKYHTNYGYPADYYDPFCTRCRRDGHESDFCPNKVRSPPIRGWQFPRPDPKTLPHFQKLERGVPPGVARAVEARFRQSRPDPRRQGNEQGLPQRM